MAKWFGKIGFVEQQEVRQGIWEPVTTEREYYGDILQNSMRYQPGSDKTNSDLNISNQFSILSDDYADENFSFMAYIYIANAKWKITDVKIARPRLILTIGGVYNE